MRATSTQTASIGKVIGSLRLYRLAMFVNRNLCSWRSHSNLLELDASAIMKIEIGITCQYTTNLGDER